MLINEDIEYVSDSNFRNLQCLPLLALFEDKEITNQFHFCGRVASREML